MSSLNATSNGLPPLDAFNLAGIWVESLFYGMNVVLWGLTLWVLLSRHIGGRRQCPLLATTNILFILGTLNVWTSLSQLLQAFTSASAHNSATFSTEFWLNLSDPKAQLREYTAVLANIEQNMVLIWRLYVVSGNWKLTVVPYALEAVHLIIGCYNTQQANVGHPNHNLYLTQWSISLVVNVTCTTFIVVRLYHIARGPRRFTQTFSTEFEKQRERWLKPIFTIVESGALFTTCNIVILAMYARNDPRVNAAVGVSVQVAIFCPLLILVRVGFGITHGLLSLKSGSSTNRGGTSGQSSDDDSPCPISTGVSNMACVSNTATTTDSIATSGDADLEAQHTMKLPILPTDVKRPYVAY